MGLVSTQDIMAEYLLQNGWQCRIESDTATSFWSKDGECMKLVEAYLTEKFRQISRDFAFGGVRRDA